MIIRKKITRKKITTFIIVARNFYILINHPNISNSFLSTYMCSTFENFLSKLFYSKCQQHININTNALYVTNKGMVSLIIFAINIHFETLFITQCDWEGGGA